MRAGLGDTGHTIVVHVTQKLVVTLAPNWTPPSASSAVAALAPLRVDAAVGFPALGAAAATFTAVDTGTATVTAHTDYVCLHTRPRCLPPQRLFRLTVTVLPLSGRAAGSLPRARTS